MSKNDRMIDNFVNKIWLLLHSYLSFHCVKCTFKLRKITNALSIVLFRRLSYHIERLTPVRGCTAKKAINLSWLLRARYPSTCEDSILTLYIQLHQLLSLLLKLTSPLRKFLSVGLPYWACPVVVYHFGLCLYYYYIKDSLN